MVSSVVMARRGKLKYRDVVGGSKKKNKSVKKKAKPRKTYSLYQKDNRKPERKHKFTNESDDLPKRPKINEAPPPQVEESSSESEIELEDHMKKLRDIFTNNSNGKKSLAIDSCSEESTDEELDNKNQDIINKEIDFKDMQEDNLEMPEEEEDDEEDGLNGSVNDNKDGLKEQSLPPDDIDNEKDPFIKHIFYDLHENLLKCLQNIPPIINKTVLNWPKLGKLIVEIPHCEYLPEEKQNEFSIDEVKKYAALATPPEKIDTKIIKPEDLFIKPQIATNLNKANTACSDNKTIFTHLQSELFSIINNYQDLYFCERNFDNAEEIRFTYCLHAVNHILKTRMKVIHHNSRLSKKDDVPEEFRDQGLVRPKILIIVPFKDAAYKIVKMIIDILLKEDKGNVINKKRFIEEYTGNELALPKKNPKPEDYELIFSGNTSDDFRMGMTITKKSLKLFADFYSSDIIIASPLGLRTIIGAEGEADRNYDFLASIEVLILDQTELFLMQNWDHLIHVFNHLHLQPKEGHGTDFARVRTWSLNGWAKYYRQTLIFSSVVLPEINSIFNKKCINFAGKVKVSNPIEYGSISQVFLQLPHVFHKFEATSVQQAIDARFEFFVNKILPQQRDILMKQTLIYVSNYFDYVRLRNYFKREDISFVQICEYSKVLRSSIFLCMHNIFLLLGLKVYDFTGLPK